MPFSALTYSRHGPDWALFTQCVSPKMSPIVRRDGGHTDSHRAERAEEIAALALLLLSKKKTTLLLKTGSDRVTINHRDHHDRGKFLLREQQRGKS